MHTGGWGMGGWVRASVPHTSNALQEARAKAKATANGKAKANTTSKLLNSFTYALLESRRSCVHVCVNVCAHERVHVCVCVCVCS